VAAVARLPAALGRSAAATGFVAIPPPAGRAGREATLEAFGRADQTGVRGAFAPASPVRSQLKSRSQVRQHATAGIEHDGRLRPASKQAAMAAGLRSGGARLPAAVSWSRDPVVPRRDRRSVRDAIRGQAICRVTPMRDAVRKLVEQTPA
jgi:hypothetical protein